MKEYVQSLLVGDETMEIPRLVKWRQAWRFPRHVSKWFEEFVEGGLSLNVCAGGSRIGNVKLDLDSTLNPHIQGAMHELPFKSEAFDRVISDPPWGINFFHRNWPFFECVRVCKVGGLIAINSTWIPFSYAVAEIDCYVRTDIPFGMASIVTVFQKFTNRYDNYRSK